MKSKNKGLQTAPDKRGKIKNCNPERSFPCGKACLGLSTDILGRCQKNLLKSTQNKALQLLNSLVPLSNKKETTKKNMNENTVTKEVNNTQKNNNPVTITGKKVITNKIKGRSTTTLDELESIGISLKDTSEIELTKEDVDKLNRVRNVKYNMNSKEEVLNSSPNFMQDFSVSLFEGKTSKLKLSNSTFLMNDTVGQLDMEIEPNTDPEEIELLKKKFNEYLESPSGKRVLGFRSYSPNNINIIESAGFKAPLSYRNKGLIKEVNERVLDNRNNDTEFSRIESKKSFITEDINNHINNKVQSSGIKDTMTDLWEKKTIEEKKSFLELESADKMAKFFNVEIPEDWETKEYTSANGKDVSFESIFLLMKASEANVKPGNKKLKGKNLISMFSNEKELLKDIE